MITPIFLIIYISIKCATRLFFKKSQEIQQVLRLTIKMNNGNKT